MQIDIPVFRLLLLLIIIIIITAYAKIFYKFIQEIASRQVKLRNSPTRD